MAGMVEPESTTFDGKTLPNGADESWWGGLVNTNDPEGPRTLAVPVSRGGMNAPYTTVSAKPGDVIVRTPGDDEKRRPERWEVLQGKGIAFDDPAFTGPDTQMEHKRKLAMEAAETPSEGLSYPANAPPLYPPAAKISDVAETERTRAEQAEGQKQVGGASRKEDVQDTPPRDPNYPTN